MQQADSDDDEEPAGYSLHSAEVVTTLKGLLKTFKQKKIQADNEEMHSRQEYEMAAAARANQIKALNKADRQFLDDLAAKCEQKAQIYDQRSSTRTAELTAIAEALELLKGDVSKMYPANDLGLIRKKAAVKKTDLKQKASAIKPLPGHWEFVFDQAPAKKEVAARRVEDADSDSDSDEADDADYDSDSDADDDSVNFLQLNRPETAAKRKQVLNFLKKRARELKSTALTTMVVKLRDAPSPFAKVKQMIQDLITRLEDEAAAEA